MSATALAGGCLCGDVRYEVRGEPIDAGYCHCRLCQRSSGAPVLAWATFAIDAFRHTDGQPAVYRSSPQGRRQFCARCGTQIAFLEEGADTIDVNLGSLDEPDAIAPEYHIWTESRIGWFDTGDSLPRYRDAGPDGGKDRQSR